MKKVVIMVTMALALAFIFIIPLTLALESCHNPVLRGDADEDSRLTISDGIYILNYLFRGGPAPECIEMADFDENNLITMGDAIKLFKFLFQGGPGPTDYYF